MGYRKPKQKKKTLDEPEANITNDEYQDTIKKMNTETNNPKVINTTKAEGYETIITYFCKKCGYTTSHINPLKNHIQNLTENNCSEEDIKITKRIKKIAIIQCKVFFTIRILQCQPRISLIRQAKSRT